MVPESRLRKPSNDEEGLFVKFAGFLSHVLFSILHSRCTVVVHSHAIPVSIIGFH